MDSILFDLDGTLWDSVHIMQLVWNGVIEKSGNLRPPITREEQERVTGLPMNELICRLFPNESPARHAELLNQFGNTENEYIWDHGGILFPDVRPVLEALGEKYRLFIVSNCQCGYIEAFLHAHKLEDCFEGHICYGDTEQGKGPNTRTIMARYGLTSPVFVGDTQGDLDAAEYAGIPFVFAEYGFGSVDHYDWRITAFRDLMQLFL